ncbi:hypothetical protein I0P70_01545 [Pontibacter sp. FD36]|uniref:hypothetical protein n=1 Tax=Pontibacter sp. FD36 TaxID=2789860 RepID=UPI0018AAB7BB|nr:hypothetical protein [Pontibacter sp. FD36]MBF8961915.1 hypothetical protein [Pontibacter sp. FD36]
MEQKTLKYLRIFIPGMIILLGSYPIFQFHLGEAFDIKGLNVTYVSFLSILLGGVYYQLNIQRLITKPSHFLITKNILDKLILAYGKSVDKEQRKNLKYKDAYMTTFYSVIDNDESLKRKGENVRFNGIFWTSTADSAVISVFFYYIYKNLTDIPQYVVLQQVFFFAALISLALHIISVIKHINLSNKQLNPIINDKKLSGVLKTKFDEILY